MVSEEGFITPNSKKRKQGRRANQPPSFENQLQRTKNELDVDGWFESVKNLATSAFAHYLVCSTHRIVCLGLGSPTNSILARAQLAFLLRLMESLNISNIETVVYDPMHDREDVKELRELGFTVLESEDLVYHDAVVPTIFYMPHCELSLYEGVVGRNCSTERLSNTFILGNRLDDYPHSMSDKEMREKFPSIHGILPRLECASVPECSKHPNAFNNLAFQSVRGSQPSEPITNIVL